ncbi:maturase K [Gossypium australe]|uniref:Maturase K n=1 Tax=Gossypium australe TaxID=47621 RepID=A0A5B6VXY5_9ROSI|nr:maturase K [Gossypium australe]
MRLVRSRVRPCLGHGLGTELRSRIRPYLRYGIGIEYENHIRPYLGCGIDNQYEIPYKTISGIWHRHLEVTLCKTISGMWHWRRIYVNDDGYVSSSTSSDSMGVHVSNSREMFTICDMTCNCITKLTLGSYDVGVRNHLINLYLLENTIKVFDELSCTPEECMKCVVSLLRDSTYQWWNTLVSVVPSERVNWEFFQEEFRKKLRKYARECISTEAIMCKRFEDGLNEDVHLFVGVLELKEFVVLVDRACKAEELVKEKRKAEIESHDSKKRQLGKSFQSSSNKSRDFTTRLATSAGFSSRSKGRQYSGSKAQTTSVASVGNARPSRLECLL